MLGFVVIGMDYFFFLLLLEEGVCMWYERPCDWIWLGAGCCGCCLGKRWWLRGSFSAIWNSCSRCFYDSLQKAMHLSSLSCSSSISVLLIHCQFHLEPVCVIWLSLILMRCDYRFAFFLGSFLTNWVPLCTIQIFIICRHHVLFICFNCMLTAVFFATIIQFLVQNHHRSAQMKFYGRKNSILFLHWSQWKLDPYLQTKAVSSTEQGRFYGWYANVICTTLIWIIWIYYEVLQWTYLPFYKLSLFLCLWNFLLVDFYEFFQNLFYVFINFILGFL